MNTEDLRWHLVKKTKTGGTVKFERTKPEGAPGNVENQTLKILASIIKASKASQKLDINSST